MLGRKLKARMTSKTDFEQKILQIIVKMTWFNEKPNQR